MNSADQDYRPDLRATLSERFANKTWAKGIGELRTGSKIRQARSVSDRAQKLQEKSLQHYTKHRAAWVTREIRKISDERNKPGKQYTPTRYIAGQTQKRSVAQEAENRVFLRLQARQQRIERIELRAIERLKVRERRQR